MMFWLANSLPTVVEPIRVIPDWRGVVESDQLITFRSSIRIQAFNDIGRLSAKDVLGIYVHGLPGA